MSISLNSAALLSGNGIDVNSLVSEVLAPQNGQLQIFSQQQSALQTQAGLLNGINNDLSALLNAVNALTDVLGPLTAQAVNSSQPSIVTGSAQTTATPGNHTVVVSTLATQGTVYTQAVNDANASILAAGDTTADLKIQVGGASGEHDIQIAQGSNDTLTTLAQYINSQNWGVTATVLNDASGARLAIFSQNTGSAGAITVVNNTTNLTFNAPVGGSNASFTVDGVPFESTTNTFTGAIPGVTLNLVAAIPDVPVQLAIGPDFNKATQAINNFVAAYNKVISDINQQFTVDPTTNSEGPLGGDNSLRLLQSSLLADATYATSSSATPGNLSALGITMNDDGTLSVNSAQLSSALSNDPSSVTSFFQNDNGTGFANNFAADLQNLTDPTLGLLNIDLSQNRQQQTDLSNAISDFQDRMSAMQRQLSKEFSQVNALIEAFPFTLRAIDEALGIQPSGSSNTAPASSTG